MKYVCLHVHVTDTAQAEQLTALLHAYPLLGTEEDTAILRLYFEEADFPGEELTQLLEEQGYTFKKETIPAQNWNAQWESGYEPLRLDQDLGIRASFHPPFEACKYDLVITPKMSFGTGHHATTAMMLRYLLEVNPAGKDVFDFGCGTGVLAILAARMGAKKVLATDHDPICVENTSENCMENGVEQVEVSMQDIGDVHASYDLILANINLNILKAHMTDLYKRLRPSGELLLSGILQQDQEAIRTAAIAAGFELVSSKTEEEWLAMQLRKAADL